MSLHFIQLALQCLQLLWTLITTSLIGNILYDAVAGNPPHAINFALFADVFAWLSLVYLMIAVNLGFFVWPVIPILLDAFNTLFWFIAGVTLSTTLGGAHSCNYEEYLMSNIISRSSVDPRKSCQEAQASTAFFWLGFVTFAVSSVMSVLTARGKLNLSGRQGTPQGLDWYIETKWYVFVFACN